MRRSFLIWLSAVICATFLLTGALAYIQFSRTAQERAEQMMHTRLHDVLELIEHAESSIAYLSRANDASALDRTRALVEILTLNPSLLSQQEELQGLCNRLGAEQICVSNAEGVIEAAVPAELVGANLSTPEDKELLAGNAAESYEIIHSTVAPGDSEHRGSMQYAGMRRRDKEGIVRLGFRTRFEEASREESSLDGPSMKLRLGEQGRVVVYRRGALISQTAASLPQVELLALPTEEVRELHIGDEDYFAYAVEGGGYRLVGLLPTSEIYKPSLKRAQTILLSNLLVFAIMFAGVSYLLQRLVVRGMWKVNEALRDITEGNLERRVEVDSSPEFTRLSNGINFMVESLRSVGEERQQTMRRGLEIARTLQSTMLPAKFPAFPDTPTVDLYAACFQADEVGGDFYDFAMPDADHLHFLVADVDAGGIPSALYMMRALTIIRAIAKAEPEPMRIVSLANRELCADNQSGICMALLYGSLNVNTGELEYVNAGKLSAMIQRGGGEYTPLPAGDDPVLGENALADFHANHLTLAPTDRLFLFSGDLLTITNARHEAFSEKRLQAALQSEAESVTDVVHNVRSAVREFVGGPKPRKDIAMLSLEYVGAPCSRAALDFTAAAPTAAHELITARLEENFAAPRDIDDIIHSVSAALAALPADTPVHLELAATEHEANVQLSYPAPARNPLETLSAPLPMDSATYEWTHENRLTLCKTLM